MYRENISTIGAKKAMTNVLMYNIADMTQEIYQCLYCGATATRKNKADRYLGMKDRYRCIVAGRLLSYAVQQNLGISEFQVETNQYGKPIIKDQPDFHFNLSHSGDWVVLAYGDKPVGVDVEQIKWDSGKENVMRRFFTPDEQEFVRGVDGQGIQERFFSIWTGKESYLKYMGVGLRKPLDSFSVLAQNTPNHFSFQPEAGYFVSLWTEDGAYSVQILTMNTILS